MRWEVICPFETKKYSWIANQLDIGTLITFAVEIQFQILYQFRIPHQNYTGHVSWIFFVKSQNMLV